MFSELSNRPEIPASKDLAPDVTKVMSCVCEHYGVSINELLVSKRGTENLPRDIAIYFVRQFCCLTLPSIGQEFEIHNYSTVSSVVQRMKLRVAKDKHLQVDVEAIRQKILKGQERT